MFEPQGDFPTAVTHHDDAGLRAGVEWCSLHMLAGDTLYVWTPLKSNLRYSTYLIDILRRYSNAEHVTGRGHAFLPGPGAVLMAWPSMDDIGKLSQAAGRRMRALCVVEWNQDDLRPWVSASSPTVLGDISRWAQGDEGPNTINPVVIEGLKSLTQTINHNNTIAAGYEKDSVVSMLLQLHDAGYAMDADDIHGWALAHGWSGKNPQELANYVRRITRGERPRARARQREGFVEVLRRRAEKGGDHPEQ